MYPGRGGEGGNCDHRKTKKFRGELIKPAFSCILSFGKHETSSTATTGRTELIVWWFLVSVFENCCTLKTIF